MTTIASLLSSDVIWQGVERDLLCAGRDHLLEALHGLERGARVGDLLRAMTP